MTEYIRLSDGRRGNSLSEFVSGKRVDANVNGTQSDRDLEESGRTVSFEDNQKIVWDLGAQGVLEAADSITSPGVSINIETNRR